MPRFTPYIIAILTAGAILAGCSHDSPNRHQPPGPNPPVRPVNPDDPDNPDNPGGGGERPGIGSDNYSFAPELKDDVWRYSGRATELRYDRGGVLVARDGDAVRVADLDGASNVDAILPAPGRDSVCPSATLRLNGKPVEMIRVKFMHRSDRSVWYDLLDADSAHHVLVTPR